MQTPNPVAPATFHGLAWGDWATWGVALFTLLSFGIIAVGLYVERSNRKKDLEKEIKQRKEDLILESVNRTNDFKRIRERQEKLDNRQNALDERATYLLESEQARHVGAFMSWPFDATPSDDQDVVEMTIVNASDLPVQDVRGYIISVKDKRVISAFPQIAIIHSGKQPKQRAFVERTVIRHDLRLVLVYGDDSGVRWRKYLDPVSPNKLADGAADLPWEQPQAQSL